MAYDAGGTVLEKTLQPLEVLHLSSECMAAVSESCRIMIAPQGTMRAAALGTRFGLVLQLTGPGEMRASPGY
jgi:uncharacterized protein (AIM24 family)